MKHSWQRIATLLLLAFFVAGSSYAHDEARSFDSHSERVFCKARLGADLFARTELFFGLSKSDGSVISEEQFQTFVDQQVTPRFPDGLTLLSGAGQFKDAQGNIIKEGSKLLILLYPFNKISSRAAEEIREAYKREFQQQSVLRVDEQSCVSF